MPISQKVRQLILLCDGRLKLQDHWIDADDIEELSELIAQNKLIYYLNISNERWGRNERGFGDDGACILAKHLPPTIIILSVRGHSIGDRGAVALIQRSLLYIDLSDNQEVGFVSGIALLNSHTLDEYSVSNTKLAQYFELIRLIDKRIALNIKYAREQLSLNSKDSICDKIRQVGFFKINETNQTSNIDDVIKIFTPVIAYLFSNDTHGWSEDIIEKIIYYFLFPDIIIALNRVNKLTHQKMNAPVVWKYIGFSSKDEYLQVQQNTIIVPPRLLNDRIRKFEDDQVKNSGRKKINIGFCEKWHDGKIRAYRFYCGYYYQVFLYNLLHEVGYGFMRPGHWTIFREAGFRFYDYNITFHKDSLSSISHFIPDIVFCFIQELGDLERFKYIFPLFKDEKCNQVVYVVYLIDKECADLKEKLRDKLPPCEVVDLKNESAVDIFKRCLQKYEKFLQDKQNKSANNSPVKKDVSIEHELSPLLATNTDKNEMNLNCFNRCNIL